MSIEWHRLYGVYHAYANHEVNDNGWSGSVAICGTFAYHRRSESLPEGAKQCKRCLRKLAETK